MIIYKCEHGHIFDENEMVRIRVPEGEYTRDRFICPVCGTDDFDEAHVCERCGEWFTADELEFELCETCREDTYDVLIACLAPFSDNQLEYLCDREEREGGLFEWARIKSKTRARGYSHE